MLKIKICVGSSCYLKGAQKIIDYLEKVVKEEELTTKVEISGAFCLGDCGDGVAISINDEIKHFNSVEEANKELTKLIKEG